MRIFHQFSALTLLSCGLAGLATASSLSFTGTFTTDDQKFVEQITTLSAGTLTVQSWAYGGGTNAAGTIIPKGGFATDVTVFSATGSQLIEADDLTGGNPPSACGPRNIDLSVGGSGLCLDGFVSTSLPAGSYLVVLTEQGNDPNAPGFADGFAQTGNPDFTGGPFIDPFSNQRNGKWALDITSASLVVSATPEPGTLFTALALVPGLYIAARRRRRQ